MTDKRKLQIVFYTDAALEIGTGHVMRCLTLAQRLASRHAECSFIVGNTAQTTVPLLTESGFPVITREKPGDRNVLRSGFPDGVDWLVVDDYRLDREFESACRDWARRIFVIDDLADREHDCDVLLDQTPARLAKVYENLVPVNCRLLLGSEFALIRAEFVEYRDASLARQRETISRIIVSLGGTDPENVSGSVLQGIADSALQDPSVDLVLGASSRHIDDLRALAGTLGVRCQVHVNTREMARLMSCADLAIGAGGISSLERCCLGLPSLLLVLADNQKDNARTLASAGAAMVMMPDSGKIRPKDVTDLLNDIERCPGALATMSLKSRVLNDGNGAERVADSILSLSED